MLNQTTCDKILKSEIWKTWSAETIVRFQFNQGYMIVPIDILEKSIDIVFPGVPKEALLMAYKTKWPNPMLLKEMLRGLPKSFYWNRIK